MSDYTLGLAGAIGHDPAAALFRGGELVAAVEEERLTRRRHARNEMPYHAVRQCLQIAGIRAAEIDRIAISYSPISLFGSARWHYAWRHWYAPDRSLDSLFNGNRRYRRYVRNLRQTLEQLHIPPDQARIVPVEHQVAHAASAYLLNEPERKTAIFCNDVKGEYSNMLFATGENGRIVKRKEFHNPDSLCGMYAALTDYFGFEILDGELKVMGIAPLGDAEKYDLSPLAHCRGGKFKVNNKLIGTVGLRRYKARSQGHYFSRKLVDLLGPRRVGNLVDDPYLHYAAAIQKLYEDMAVQLIEHHLGDVLDETGILAVAGTGSMNIRLNQRLAAMDKVERLIVHPACSDSGTAIGAAAWAIRQSGVKLQPVENVLLGPEFTSRQCVDACRDHREKPIWEELEDPYAKAVELLAAGELVGWFRGRLEFGQRALGNRSVLANPQQENVADQINRQLKFREVRRPFACSVLAEASGEMLAGQQADRYRCIGVRVDESWRRRYPGIAYADGSTRVQVVDAEHSPDFHRLLALFNERTGHPLLFNTSMSRPGEALVCTPEHAVELFVNSGLKYLILENLLVTRRAEEDSW